MYRRYSGGWTSEISSVATGQSHSGQLRAKKERKKSGTKAKKNSVEDGD